MLQARPNGGVVSCEAATTPWAHEPAVRDDGMPEHTSVDGKVPGNATREPAPSTVCAHVKDCASLGLAAALTRASARRAVLESQRIVVRVGKKHDARTARIVL